MMNTALNTHDILVLISSTIGTTGAVFALAAWLGNIWATRILDRERAKVSVELETFRDQLGSAADEKRDALLRRRDVYAALASTMRVFLSADRKSSDAEKRKFLEAYDVACLWASEPVVEAIGSFIDLMRVITAHSAAVPQSVLQGAYQNCMQAMRKDTGFPETKFNYRIVSFT